VAEEISPTVRALLQKSLERMDEDLVRRFARLGVLPPKPLSFGPWAATDLWRDTSEDPPEGNTSEAEQGRTRDALGELARRGLVEPAGGGVDPLAEKLNINSERAERFWMHALVAAFALETLNHTEGEGGVRGAQQRRLEHYRRIVGAADGGLNWGGDAQLFSVYLMALDLPNIRAAHEWALSHSSGDRRALEYLSRLPSQGSRSLSERLEQEEFLRWMRMAEEAARKIGDEDAVRKHVANVGVALIRAGRTQDALRFCRKSLETARLHNDASVEATALVNLASIHNLIGEHETALDLARQAEEAAKKGDSSDIEAGAIGQQGASLESLRRIPEAEKLYEDMRDRAWSSGELSEYAKALRELSRIKRYRPEERNEARHMYEEAADVFWNRRQYSNYRRALTGLGILELIAGSLDAAEEAFGRVLKSAVDDGDETYQARTKMNLGNVHLERGTKEGVEVAEAEYREALPLAVRSGDPELLGDISFNLAVLLSENSYSQEARAMEARLAAEKAAKAYSKAGSDKKSKAQSLMDEIDDENGW